MCLLEKRGSVYPHKNLENNMGRKKKSELDLVHASPSQIQELKSEINYLESMLASEAGSKIQDRTEFNAEIAKKREVLQAHAPKKLRGEKANKLLKQARELEKDIKEAMVPAKEAYQPYPKNGSSFDFERSVKQQMAFQLNKGIQKKVAHYKNIMRRLDPDDPTIANIERLRR